MAAPKADDNNRDRIVFSKFKPRWPLLGLAAFIQAFYKEIFFLQSLLTALYLAYIPISLLPRNKRLMCLFPVKTRRLFGADVQLRKYCITKQDSALLGLFKSYFT